MKQHSASALLLGIGSLVVITFTILLSPEQGIAAAAGTLLGFFNYWGLYHGATRFFEAVREGAVGSRSWLLLAVLRLFFLAGVLVLLLKWGFEPLGLVVGLSLPALSQVIWSSLRAFVQAPEARG